MREMDRNEQGPDERTAQIQQLVDNEGTHGYMLKALESSLAV